MCFQNGVDLSHSSRFKRILELHLHAAREAEDKVASRLLLDVVVGQCVAILKLFANEDQALLVRRDARLVLVLGLGSVYGVGCLHIQRHGFARQSLSQHI